MTILIHFHHEVPGLYQYPQLVYPLRIVVDRLAIESTF